MIEFPTTLALAAIAILASPSAAPAQADPCTVQIDAVVYYYASLSELVPVCNATGDPHSGACQRLTGKLDTNPMMSEKTSKALIECAKVYPARIDELQRAAGHAKAALAEFRTTFRREIK